MEDDIKISLVIPTYEREGLIQEAIESALRQTRKINEIIIIDNNSSDNTFQIAQEYAKKYDNVKALKNDHNVGMINNWNNGVKKVKNEYVSILHSDDIIPPDWCEKITAAIKQNKGKNVALYFGIYVCFRKENGKMKVISRIKNFPRDEFFPPVESLRRLWEKFYGNPNCSAAIIYKKSIFEEIGYFDADKGTEADQEFHIRVLNAYNSYYIAKDLVYYRRHEFQAYDFQKETESAWTNVKRLFNAIEIQKKTLKDPELVRYTYCGVYLYAIKFLLTFHFAQFRELCKIKGIFNAKTILNLPRFLVMFAERKFLSRYY